MNNNYPFVVIPLADYMIEVSNLVNSSTFQSFNFY